MRTCQQALHGALTVARVGNRNAASDAGVGIELLLAAVRGAGMNVDANLPGIKDAGYVDRVRTERQELEREALADAERARQQLAT
jgi:formiminotetrahydrofolate cyclodeaminase